MKAWITLTTLATLTLCGTIAASAAGLKPAVDKSKPAAAAAATDDNMTPYRTPAADTLKAFKAQDLPTAKEGPGARSGMGQPRKSAAKEIP